MLSLLLLKYLGGRREGRNVSDVTHTRRVFFLRGGLTNRSAAVSFPQFFRLSFLTSQPHPGTLGPSYPARSRFPCASRNAPFCRVSSPHLSQLRLVRSPVCEFIPVISFLNFPVATRTTPTIFLPISRRNDEVGRFRFRFLTRWRRRRKIAK